MELQSGKRQIWVKIGYFLSRVILTFCMDITSVNGNISRKFQDDAMTGTLSKRCDGRTERRTEISVLSAAWSQLKMKMVMSTKVEMLKFYAGKIASIFTDADLTIKSILFLRL